MLLDRGDDGVDAPKSRPQRQVLALDVEPAGGLCRREPLARVGGKHRTDRERAPLTPERVAPQVVPDQRGGRIAGCEPVRQCVRVADADVRVDLSAAPAGDAETGRRVLPPGLDQPGGLARLVPARNRHDPRPVVGTGRFEQVGTLAGREEGLAQDRPLEHVQRVGGRAPEVAAASLGQLSAKNVPGRDPVSPIRCRVGRLQRGGDGLADRVVQDEPVRIGLDEGQTAKQVE